MDLYPGFSLADELELLVNCGLKAEEALRAATRPRQRVSNEPVGVGLMAWTNATRTEMFCQGARSQRPPLLLSSTVGGKLDRGMGSWEHRINKRTKDPCPL